MKEILPTLKFIHQAKVIHRDIKPSNIIRRVHDNQLVVIDFGAVKEIATTTAVNNGKTTVTVAIGTPGYMPNEQLGGKPRFCSDIYAVGMIAIQALTGQSPDTFPEDVRTAEILWHGAAPSCSPQLRAILDKTISYDFRQRFQSAQEVLDAINSTQRLSIISKPAKAIRKKTIVNVSSLGIFLLVGVVGIQSLFSKNTSVEMETNTPSQTNLSHKAEDKAKNILPEKTSLVDTNNSKPSKTNKLEQVSKSKEISAIDRDDSSNTQDKNRSESNFNDRDVASSNTQDKNRSESVIIIAPNPLKQIKTQVSQVSPQEEALLREAGKLYAQRQYQSALEIVDQVVQNNPNLPIAWSFKSRIHVKLNQFEQAQYARNRNLQLSINDRVN